MLYWEFMHADSVSGGKNLWLRFHLKQLDTYHNTTECFVCQKSWLKLTQMPSTCNCKYSQENIQRFESFFAHISKTKHTFAYIMWLNFEWNHLCLCQNEVECLHLIYLALISETKATWKQNVVSCFPIQSFSRYDTRRTNIGNGKMTYTHMQRDREREGRGRKRSDAPNKDQDRTKSRIISIRCAQLNIVDYTYSFSWNSSITLVQWFK